MFNIESCEVKYTIYFTVLPIFRKLITFDIFTFHFWVLNATSSRKRKVLSAMICNLEFACDSETHSRLKPFHAWPENASGNPQDSKLCTESLHILIQSDILTRRTKCVVSRGFVRKRNKRLAPFALNKLEVYAGATRYFLIGATFTARKNLPWDKNPQVEDIFAIT